MPAPPRVISAVYTPLVKFAAPPLALWWVGRLAIGWIRYGRSHTHTPSFSMAVVIFSVAFFAFVAWSSARLKRVALADGALHVSNFRRAVVIPLRDVASVEQSLLRSAVVIDLERPTELGRRVEFLPRRIHLASLWSHPIVDDLRFAVAAARRSGR